MSTEMQFYEIYDLTANELLADNLKFCDVPELFQAMTEFYLGHNITVCRRTVAIKECRRVFYDVEVTRRKFFREWLDLIDELATMGNVC